MSQPMTTWSRFESFDIANLDAPATSETIIEDEAFMAQSVTVWPKSGTTPR